MATNTDGYKALEEIVINALEEPGNYNLDEEVQKMINQHWEIGTGRAEYRVLHGNVEALEAIDEAFYDALLDTKKADTDSDGEAKFMLVGKEIDGTEVYETSEETKALSLKEKKKALVNKIRNEYRGRTAKFTKDGAVYYATLDRAGAKKGIYGDKKSDKKRYVAKITIGADGNYFELSENSKYSRSMNEKGKTTDTNIHNKVKTWDYFVKAVKSDGNYFDVLINVADKGNNQFVYDITLNENKKTTSPSNSKKAAFSQGDIASNTNISQSDKGVNSYDMQETKKDTKYEANDDGKVRFMLSNTSKMPYSEQMDGYFNNDSSKIKRSDDIYVGNIGFETSIGISNKPFATLKSNITKSMRVPTGNSRSAHGISEEFIRNIPEKIKNAPLLILSNDGKRLSIITDEKQDGNPILIGVALDSNTFDIPTNEIKSIYQRYGFAEFLSQRTKDSKMFFNNIKKGQALLRDVGVEFPKPVAYDDLSSEILSQLDKDVNTKFMLPNRYSDESDVRLYRNFQYVKKENEVR